MISLRKIANFIEIANRAGGGNFARTSRRIVVDVLHLFIKHPDLLLLPELLKVSGESSGLKKQTDLILLADDCEVVMMITITSENGKIKKLDITDESDDVKTTSMRPKKWGIEKFHAALEERMGRIHSVSIIEVDALKNIVMAGKRKKDKIFHAFIAIMEELKGRRIVLYPMNFYLDLMCEVDSEDIALKFIAPLGLP